MINKKLLESWGIDVEKFSYTEEQLENIENPYSVKLKVFKEVDVLMLKNVTAESVNGFFDPENDLEKDIIYQMINFGGKISVGRFMNGSGRGMHIRNFSKFQENIHFIFI